MEIFVSDTEGNSRKIENQSSRTKKPKKCIPYISLSVIFVFCACFVFFGNYTFLQKNVTKPPTKINDSLVIKSNASSGCD